MATILNLFSDAVWSGLIFGAPTTTDPLEALRLEAVASIKAEGLGCCKHCHLRGLCDSDDCGAREYSGARFKYSDRPPLL